MLTIAGPAAETSFRLDKLAREIAGVLPAITGVSAHFEHYIRLEQSLSDQQERILRALLDYGDKDRSVASGQALYVVPRLGTISPWASKATDIARICGLPVARIERGRVYVLETATELTAEALAAALPFLYDRMTETALTEPPVAAQLFADHQPRPVAWIELMSRGRQALLEADGRGGR